MKNPVPSHIKTQVSSCEKLNPSMTGALQPHGFLIGFRLKDYSISHISTNLGAYIAVNTEALETITLHAIFDEHSIECIKEQITLLSIKPGMRFITVKTKIAPCHIFSGIIYFTGATAHLELMPAKTNRYNRWRLQLSQYQTNIAGYIANVGHSIDESAKMLCDAIHKITRMSRVYICIFDGDDHGFVPYEYNDGEMQSLLYHHFPAYDIPQFVRILYTQNRLRHMPDINAVPCGITTLEGHALECELYYSLLRKVADSHIIYQRALGVAGSCSFSMVQQDKLIGIIGAHHPRPHLLAPEELAACQHLTEIFTTKYILENQLTIKDNLLQRYHQLHELADQIRANYNASPALAFTTCHQQSKNLFLADDFVGCYDGQERALNRLSKEHNKLLYNIVREELAHQPVIFINCLSEYSSHFALVKQEVSGILAIKIADNIIMLWARKERHIKQLWAGDPAQALEFRFEGIHKLASPRTSFESWLREIEEHCTPWTLQDKEIAMAFYQLFHHTFLQPKENDVLSGKKKRSGKKYEMT